MRRLHDSGTQLDERPITTKRSCEYPDGDLHPIKPAAPFPSLLLSPGGLNPLALAGNVGSDLGFLLGGLRDKRDSWHVTPSVKSVSRTDYSGVTVATLWGGRDSLIVPSVLSIQLGRYRLAQRL